MNNFGKLALSLLFALIVFSSPAAAREPSSPQTIYLNEKRTIAALQTIYGAQITFITTDGAGNFGSFARLHEVGLIDASLASGEKHGYRFAITVQNHTPGSAADFQVVAVPRGYRKTGRRSFFINAQGMIRGADKRGAFASASDPFIAEYYACDSEVDCEAKAIRSLRILHSAETTYQATRATDFSARFANSDKPI